MAPKPDPAVKKKPIVKAPKPKPTKTAPPKFDPYNALGSMSPTGVASFAAREAAQGPDYSHVPTVDFGKLRAAATQQANIATQPAINELQQARDDLKPEGQRQAQIASNFAAAFASIAGGGNANIDDPAAQKYALENFGGSYVGGMAAALGARIVGQQSASLTEQDGKYAGQIADIMSKRPDIAERIYDDVAKAATDLVKQGRDAAELDHANKLKALAAYGKAIKDSGPKISTVTQPGGAVVGYDKATGRVVYKIPGVAGGGGSSGGGGGGSSRVFGNSETGYYTKQGNKLVPIPGYTPESTPTGTDKKGAKIYAKGTAYDMLNGLSPTRQASEILKWKKSAAVSAGRAKTGRSIDPATGDPFTYQTALAFMMNEDGIPLDIAQAALNKYWRKPGSQMTWEKPGQGRPAKSFQQANPGASPGGSAKNVAFNTSYSGGGGPGLVQVLQQAGFQGNGLRTAYAIAMRESGGRPDAFNGNTGTGDRSWGLFQINTLGSLASRIKKLGLRAEQDLLDPVTNALAAFKLSRGGRDFGAWGIGPNAYRSGAGFDTISQYYNQFPGSV
jgi:hypothetical protein